MRKAGAPKPHRRDGIWYLVRRVPAAYAALDRRGLVRISTDIRVADDPKGVRAAQVVERLGVELEAYWRGLRDGQSAEARIRFEAAQKRARALGLPYQTAGELAEAPIADLLARVRLLVDRKAVDDEAEVAAVMGGEARPAINLSGLLTEYEALQSAKLKQMSEGQMRKWRNPKKRAVANFIKAIEGDKALTDVTRKDAIAFRRWWQDRILNEDLDIATANKDIGHVSKMLRVVERTHELGVGPIFAELRIEGAVKKQRAAFNQAQAEAILAPGALDDLNDEARDVAYMVAAVGMRPIEVCFLDASSIHLDAEVPFVSIAPDGRVLKTEDSRREMPLTGLALEVMKRNPAGFPRYRDKSDSLSALVNKTLDNRGLLPTDRHSLYSFRHYFEDRLTAVDAPDKMIAVMMGHKHQRPKYGAGPSLEHKREWLDRIEITRRQG